VPREAHARSAGWLARLSFALAFLGIAVLLAVAGWKSIAMVAVGLAAAAVSLAAAFVALSRRGFLRWLSLAVFILTPIVVLVVYAFAGLLWVAAVAASCWYLAGLAAQGALARGRPDWRMPEFPAEPLARHPFVIMNPRSGGGKVGKFDLRRKAEALGAEVFVMSGPEQVDVAEVARQAVAGGADLLGVAGGDGTQALVAGVAAEHDIPFLVITAGTRNHFALDLGLDRENPAACLDALTDGVDLRVDLGVIGGQTFVNNASFGAYAEVVETPGYRGDKLGTTLDTLPDLLQGHRGPRLSAVAGDVTIDAPQALLVSSNPYGTGDIAGLNRRSRLDRGVLGVVAVTVDSAAQAAGLLRGRHTTGLRVLTVPAVVVTASAPRIHVGIDGEAVSLPVPVQCAIRPGALRVRVPRNRPGVPAPRPAISWSRLSHLAWPWRWPRSASEPADEHVSDPLAAASHPDETGLEPDASRLRSAHRPFRRAGARQGVGGADDDFRHRAPGRVVGQQPGGTRQGHRSDRRRAWPGSRGAHAGLRDQFRPPAVVGPVGARRAGAVLRLRGQAAADGAVPRLSAAGRGDRGSGSHRRVARLPAGIYVPALEPPDGGRPAGAEAHAPHRAAGPAAVLQQEELGRANWPPGTSTALSTARHGGTRRACRRRPRRRR